MIIELLITQENKELLLKDLCARLSYGVKIHIESCGEIWDDILDSISIGKAGSTPITYINRTVILENCICKSYLRPMSSMTVEEMKAFPYPYYFDWIDTDRKTMCSNDECSPCLDFDEINDVTDWLNKHHFDYRGLIEKGLAIEAPEGMYNLEKK